MKSNRIASNHLLQELSTSNKENDFQNFGLDITKAKQFSSSSINENDPKHKTSVGLRNHVLDQISNKTTIQGRTSKTMTKTTKLEDLQGDEHIVRKMTGQKEQVKNEPLKVILNTPIQIKNEPSIAMSSRRQAEVVKSQRSIKKAKEREKTEINQKKKIKQESLSYEKQTPSVLIKQQVDESVSHLRHNKGFDQFESTNMDLTNHASVFDQCSHIMKQIKQNYTINHVFNRHLSCALSEPVVFHLPTKAEQIITSQKVSRFLHSQFKIFLNKAGSKQQLGTLKSNFTGSVYNFYPKDADAIYFSILFSTKKVDGKQGFRHCQIYLNKGIVSESVQSQVIPYSKMQSLHGLYLLNSQGGTSYGQILKFQSKMPVWSQQYQSYSLKFPQKGVMPSVKNTIFTDQKDNEVMLFYKNSHLTYDVSFKHPLSWIVAYGYTLASTDFKLATQ